MSAHEEFRKGQKTLCLENEQVLLRVLPNLGGKIASFYDKAHQFESLFQCKEREYQTPCLYSPFDKYDASGFDDAFPNINESVSPVNGHAVHFPDHGEIWSSSLEYALFPDKICLSYEGQVLPYSYQKEITLAGNSVKVSYTIRNTGKEAITCLWTMHCLAVCNENTRVLYPRGADLAKDVLSTDDPEENIRVFSLTQSDFLTRMPAQGQMRKIYLSNRVSVGDCSFVYPEKALRFRIRYDDAKLPYLGLWCTMGGFRGDFNAALEPSTGFYDSIDTARAQGALPMLAPDDVFQFDVSLTVEEYGKEC